MKRIYLFLFIVLLSSMTNYSYSNSNYYRNIDITSRFGYAYNYDAFTYGISLYYRNYHSIGITAGFDGYHIPHGTIITPEGNEIQTSKCPLPLWDCRIGLTTEGDYTSIALGAIIGKTNVSDTGNEAVADLSKNMWHLHNPQNHGVYGGFITILIPTQYCIGFNIDIALTNKTGVNITAGLNYQIPVK